MKKVTLKVITVLAISVLTVNAFAAGEKEVKHDVKVSINSHSLVGLSSTEPIELKPAAPLLAGEGLNFDTESSTHNSIWLNYSSIIIDKVSNSISVSMVGDVLPQGVTIELVAGNDNGKGKGKVGQSSNAKVVLKNEAQTLISGIKNCYTGTGVEAGHQLTYSLKMEQSNDNYEKLTSDSFTTTILYTITDN